MTSLLAQRPRADRAFERLYRKHVHAVYRYSLAVLHNQADAEDVTQTTFMSAYRAFTRGERPEQPHNWLIKIAHNVCRQRFRDSARRPQEVALTPYETLAAPEPDADTPTAVEIRRALGFLSFNQRAALVMRELEGRSYAEIGEVLNISLGAVETLLFRGRRALREQLGAGLTCEQAELTLTQLQERRLTSAERGTLRAHLRECKDCAALERRQRAQRATLKGLATLPLPSSLSSFFGGSAVGGGAAVAGTGLGAKAAAVLAAGLVSAGIGHEAVQAIASGKEPASSAQPAFAQTIGFSPISTITGGRASSRPLGGVPGARRVLGRLADARARRRLADGHSDEEAAAAPGSAGPAAATAPSAPAATQPLAGTVPVQTPRPPTLPTAPSLPPAPISAPPVPSLPPAPPVPPAPPLPPVPPAPPLPPLPPPPLPPLPPPPLKK